MGFTEKADPHAAKNWREKSGSNEAQQEHYLRKRKEKGTHGGSILLRSSTVIWLWRRRSTPVVAGWSSTMALAVSASCTSAERELEKARWKRGVGIS